MKYTILSKLIKYVLVLSLISSNIFAQNDVNTKDFMLIHKKISELKKKIQSSKYLLVIYSDKTMVNYYAENVSKLPSSIKYIYMNEQDSKLLEPILELPKMPLLRLYYQDMELYSDFSLQIEKLNKSNTIFEINDFIKRKLSKSYFNIKNSDKNNLSYLNYAKMNKKGIFTFLNDSSLKYCHEHELLDNSSYVKMLQKIFAKVSFVESPEMAFYFSSLNDFQREILFDSNNSDEFISESDICNSYYFLNTKNNKLTKINLEEIINLNNNVNESSKKLLLILKDIREGKISEFNLLSEEELMNLNSNFILFVNEDFLTNFANEESKNSLLKELKKIKLNGITSLGINDIEIFLFKTTSNKFIKNILGNTTNYYLYHLIDKQDSNSLWEAKRYSHARIPLSYSEYTKTSNMASFDLNAENFIRNVLYGKSEIIKMNKEWNHFVPEDAVNELVNNCNDDVDCREFEICEYNRLISYKNVNEISAKQFKEYLMDFSFKNANMVYLFNNCVNASELIFLSNVYKSLNEKINIYLFDISLNELDSTDIKNIYGEKNSLLFIKGKNKPSVLKISKFVNNLNDIKSVNDFSNSYISIVEKTLNNHFNVKQEEM